MRPTCAPAMLDLHELLLLFTIQSMDPCGGCVLVNFVAVSNQTDIVQHCTRRPRDTNPLQPTYSIPAKSVTSVPISCRTTVPEGHVFHAMRHPEWGFNRGSQPLGTQNRDIDGSYAKPARPQVSIL